MLHWSESYLFVIKTKDKFNKNLGDYVGVKGHYDGKKNWRQDGWVVLN
jgi:hypothetical protein